MRASSVDRWIKKWQKRLGVSMPFTVNWCEDSSPQTSVENGETLYAEVQWGHAGAAIDVYIYPEFVIDIDSDVMRERVILHELLHPVLNCNEEDVVNRAVEIMWRAYEKV